MKSLFFVKIVFSALYSNLDMGKLLYAVAENCFCNLAYDTLLYPFLLLVGKWLLRRYRRGISCSHEKAERPRPRSGRKKEKKLRKYRRSDSVSERGDNTSVRKYGKHVFILKTRNNTILIVL